ncbi:MAG: sugar nucleotide-binding protein, partial [Proteobacteria bacterium]|nr:sugar nucleotide-binding protein [Pseudomonadota bacterium]
YDAEGRNFVRTMLRLAQTRDEIGVVADQLGCPTFAEDLADALIAIAKRTPTAAGLYHCAGAGETSWAGFAEEIFRLARARGGPSARVIPIASSAYPTPAPRPANSRLDCAKLAADYGVRMRPWQAALSACIDAIAADGWRVE